MLLVPKQALPPAMIFAMPPLLLFFGKLAKILYVYLRHMRVPVGTSIGAAVAGLALSHTIGKAVIYGLVTRTIPFFRTPKMSGHGGMLQALAEAREELYILILLWGAMAGLLVVHEMDTTDAYAWLAMLLLQSLAYLAAVVMSFLAVMPPRESPLTLTQPAS
jgi:hypothetical protein